MKTIFAGLAVGTITLSGCTSYGVMEPATAQFPVEIISDPPGAQIEINDNLVGKTPLTVNIEGWEATRTAVRSQRVLAYPVRDGQETQAKVLLGWSEPDDQYGSVIPTTMYFDMSLVTVPEYQNNININNRGR